MSKHEMLQIQTENKSMATDKKRWRVFADWLKTQRENAKLSQDDLGDLVGKDRQTIYRLENAISGTKRETVIELAKVLKADEAEALIKAGFSPQVMQPQRVKNAQEFLDALQALNLKIPQFFTGIKGLELVGEDELNEVLSLMYFQLQQKAERKTQP